MAKKQTPRYRNTGYQPTEEKNIPISTFGVRLSHILFLINKRLGITHHMSMSDSF